MTDQAITRNDRVVFRRLEAGAGGVLLHLDSGEYRQLNETGALIWALLDQPRSRGELISELRHAIADPPPTLELEVDRFLAALEERGLIATDRTAA